MRSFFLPLFPPLTRPFSLSLPPSSRIFSPILLAYLILPLVPRPPRLHQPHIRSLAVPRLRPPFSPTRATPPRCSPLFPPLHVSPPPPPPCLSFLSLSSLVRRLSNALFFPSPRARAPIVSLRIASRPSFARQPGWRRGARRVAVRPPASLRPFCLRPRRPSAGGDERAADAAVAPSLRSRCLRRCNVRRGPGVVRNARPILLVRSSALPSGRSPPW